MELLGDIQHVHDPALIAHEGKWHLFSTGNGIPYRTSDDGVRWKYIREVFDDVPAWGKEAVPGVRNPWAPDISYRDGRFWLYYSLSTFGSQHSAIGLATNATPDSPHWRDEGLVFASKRGDPYNAIDPNVFQEKSGRLWLTFGSFWKGLFTVELNPKTGKPLAGTTPRCLAARPEGTAIEAAFLMERDGWVYLFAAADFCCRGAKSTYKTIVGRARSVEGPFVDKAGVPLTDGGGTVLTLAGPRWRGPGHPGVVRVGKDDWLAVHAYDAQSNGIPTLRLEKLRWKGGWPERVVLEKASPSREISGVWEHRVGRGAATQLTLTLDGTIDSGPAKWEREGEGFVLRWPATEAPGGFWVDRCQLNKDRQSYTGTNQGGLKITGVRVA